MAYNSRLVKMCLKDLHDSVDTSINGLAIFPYSNDDTVLMLQDNTVVNWSKKDTKYLRYLIKKLKGSIMYLITKDVNSDISTKISMLK